MNLPDSLRHIAHHTQLDADALIAYASEDPHGGYLNGWRAGSLWTPEGQTLYALVRALKPRRVVEIGTLDGCSATHIAAALKANGSGRLICVDTWIACGDGIHDELRHIIEIVHQDAVQWLELQPAGSIDFLFEDAAHGTELTYGVWREGVKRLTSDGMMISHDWYSPHMGEYVRAGIGRAGYGDKVLTLLQDNSDCGFAMWQKSE